MFSNCFFKFLIGVAHRAYASFERTLKRIDINIVTALFVVTIKIFLPNPASPRPTKVENNRTPAPRAPSLTRRLHIGYSTPGSATIIPFSD
jgi:hypothetical protein